LRASFAGIDLILEEGKNVVCTFPDGDDPIVLPERIYEDLVSYLENNAKDFRSVQSLALMNEANNDPIKKKADSSDMVVSISKIPDRIKEKFIFRNSPNNGYFGASVTALGTNGAKKTSQKQAKKLKTEQSFEVVKDEPQIAQEKSTSFMI
jgi:DNA primase